MAMKNDRERSIERLKKKLGKLDKFQPKRPVLPRVEFFKNDGKP
jgi:hypothetical protein